MRVSVDIAPMRKAHEQIYRGTVDAVKEALEEAAAEIHTQVRTKPGFTPRTRKLQAGTRTKLVRTRGGRLLRITNPVPYAPFIERGTKRITPRWFLRRATMAGSAVAQRTLVDRLRRVVTRI